MLRITAFIFALFSGIQCLAQVTFTVTTLPDYTPVTDSLYIAGDFTGWQPGVAEYMLHKNQQGKWSITLADKPDGTILRFKFTRGSWETVEKGPSGEEIPDRNYMYGNADSVNILIANWADAGGSNSTAAPNVKIISTDFSIPQLNRTRRIWMYFPPDYETSSLRYPVLYMHDGQNLFDVTTSFSGEWEVDETLNKLAAQGKNVPLVVGIDNGGGDRIDEYTTWANPQYGGGDGELYIDFIIETLKPYIDANFRTMPERENTGIMGSSLGGLISHYGLLQKQNIFGKAGLFSPSYWFSDSVWTYTHNIEKQYDSRIYQLCGTNESGDMVGDMQRMNDSLIARGFQQEYLYFKTVQGGQHNEKLWREAFEDAYLWLFGNYAQGINDKPTAARISFFPNPATAFISLPSEYKGIFDTVLICDITGKELLRFENPALTQFDIRSLPSGTYLIKCYAGRSQFENKFLKQ